jgi:hypothetical protein
MRDFHNNISPAVALNATAISSNTTTAGAIIDTQAFEALEFIIQSATITDGTYTPLVEYGDQSNLSDAAAVPDAELISTEAAAAFVATDDNKVKRIGYIGAKRYVRLSLVSTGVTSGGTLSAVAVKARPSLMAVA